MRDGFAELSPGDQANMARRATVYEGVKKACEFSGLRRQRFELQTRGDSVPSGTKRLYLLRHGEGEHNVWRATEQRAGRTPTAKRHNHGQFPAALHDPLLTVKGRDEATSAAAVACKLPRPDLLVTSPLRRATETCLTAFADAVSAGVPVVAHELCRESFHGTDPSIYDSRLSRDKLAVAYPHVDFTSHVLAPSEAFDDPLWWQCASPFGLCGPHGVDEAAIAESAYQFLLWLMARPEDTIAVASHANFLLALYHGCLNGVPATPQVFHTGELRAVTVSVRWSPDVYGGAPGTSQGVHGMFRGRLSGCDCLLVEPALTIPPTPSTLDATATERH